MIATPDFMNILYEILLTLEWCLSGLQSYTYVFWVIQRITRFSSGMGIGLVEKWWGCSRNSSMIAIQGFINLAYELILTLYWYPICLLTYTYVFWVKTTTKRLMFLLNGDWLGRKWQGWSRNAFLVPVTDLMKLFNEIWFTSEYITTIYNHPYMYFGPTQPHNYSISLPIWDLLGRK